MNLIDRLTKRWLWFYTAAWGAVTLHLLLLVNSLTIPLYPGEEVLKLSPEVAASLGSLLIIAAPILFVLGTALRGVEKRRFRLMIGLLLPVCACMMCIPLYTPLNDSAGIIKDSVILNENRYLLIVYPPSLDGINIGGNKIYPYGLSIVLYRCGVFCVSLYSNLLPASDRTMEEELSSDGEQVSLRLNEEVVYTYNPSLEKLTEQPDEGD